MLLYHITSYKNISSIIAKGGLIAKNFLHDIDYESIAYEAIQNRRHYFKVPAYPYGTLHDYVPFHFAPRSPMLYTIKRGNVNIYSGSQEDLVYLVFESSRIVGNVYECIFTDGHPIMKISKFYSGDSCIENSIDR